jgi:hypothetical protein
VDMWRAQKESAEVGDFCPTPAIEIRIMLFFMWL